jgi:hypothetical protein
MITMPTQYELNAMSREELNVALAGDVGKAFSEMAQRHVTWLFWTKNTLQPTNILGQGTAFILDRGSGPMLVTAAHVYRQYLDDQKKFGDLYCQIGNASVQNLSQNLIACGDLHVPLGDSTREPDIATFRINSAALKRLRKAAILATKFWPKPPVKDQAIMFAGYPGHERDSFELGEMSFGLHTGLLRARTITDRQITMLIEREHLVGWTDLGVPVAGYGLGGISGGPLLVPEFGSGGWYFRLGGVISEAPGPRASEDVIFEMIVAERAEFINQDGTLAKVL